MTDIEKQVVLQSVASLTNGDVEEYSESSIKKRKQSVVEKVLYQSGAEETGVQRIEEHQRTDQKEHSIAFVFSSINMIYLGFSIGMSGPATFGLAFWDSVLVIIFFNAIGVLPVGLMSTFGPEFGLRQMVLSRYWVGYQGVKIFASINAVICIGWEILNNVAGAGLLHTLGNGALPPWAAILIMSACSTVISLLGYDFIHKFEAYSWVPVFIISFVLIARITMSGSFSTGTMATGRAEAGMVLTYGADIFGNAAGWTLYGCDYSVYMKKTSSKHKIFWYVTSGTIFSLVFTQIIGVAAAVCMYNNTDYAYYYETQSAAGLTFAILVHKSLHGFGGFCVVLLALSLTSANVACSYSSSLSAQAVWPKFKLVPRLLWTLAANGIALGVSIPCFYKFSDFMENFMGLISYFVAIYLGIFLSEHFIYKRQTGYEAHEYENKAKLPVGYAAIFAFACGVGGATVGMNETYWTGPIAKDISSVYPGDVAFPISLAMSFIGHLASYLVHYEGLPTDVDNRLR
ncbi:hypothetical protein PACTADRAFT_17767 [Pachysolen tannophilus NRRL Y-2460]|uniref:Purine-cytosine permease n=1 Tax=Pachysolen tannophilus NRRL Y-2460 TaxID=669874 RepID=A0A1E4TQI2_PACTA|nr:hypothetical protein PACTADRAFT_17767 [Pachysolen tannophilus NRRL Y-2460]